MKNIIQEIQSNFQTKKIDKQTYISSMYEALHARLHDLSELIKESEVTKVEVTSQGVIAEIRGIKLLMTKGDERLAPIDAINFGTYEKEEIDMILKLLSNAQTFYDIGANIGLYSLMAANKYPTLKIHAFEPLPRTHEFLLNNISINKATTIETHNNGFSEKEGEFSFFFEPSSSVSASMQNIKESTGAQEIKCPVFTLDSFTKKHNHTVDFIKCDVEGAEILVLRGGVAMLKKDKPILFLEMLRKWSQKFNYHPNDIITLLSELGYECYTIHGKFLESFTKVNDETTATNYVFLDSIKHQHILKSLSSNQ